MGGRGCGGAGRPPSGHPGTFPEKANYGYRNTAEPWLFFAGDDNKFYPGWLDQAMAVAKTTGAQVTGTNDMHNPRVLAGEHSTNWLITRQYVDETGASWDGPGTVTHEGYGHWFADDEIVTAAKHRGTYAHAQYSRVENQHPAWGLGEKDKTWQHEQELMAGDREKYLARLAEHGTQAAAVTAR